MKPTISRMVHFLDRELRVADFEDVSNNGLQVENSGTVRRVCCGVDASMEFIEEARRRGADLLVCHHGLSWGDSLKRITDLNYRRLSFLLRHDMALYACHLPLDAHPRYGNNAGLFRALGLKDRRPFGLYNGVTLGFEGKLPTPMSYLRFKERVRKSLGSELRTMDCGRKMVQRVAVVSGGAADELEEAGQKGVDVFISGEAKLSAWHLAQEYGIHAIFAGHYATEIFGVRSVASLLARRFTIKCEFVDFKTPW